MLLVVARDGDRHLKAVRIAGLGEERLRLLDVLLVVIRQGLVKVLAERREHGAADAHAVAVAHEGDDLVNVHGIAQRLTDADVVKRGDGVVEVERLHELHGVLVDVEAVLDRLGLIGREVRADVDGAGFEREHE